MEPFIRLLPVRLFGCVMGVAGLALAWQHASEAHGADTTISTAFAIFALLLFAAMSVPYVAKMLLHPDVAKQEFEDPEVAESFGAVGISVLLVSQIVGSYGQALQFLTWGFGSMIVLVLNGVLLYRVLERGRIGIPSAPAMLTASVASLLVAAAGSSPAFAWAREIDLLAAAIGSFGSVLSFCRKDARPTMMLTAAPFAVGFVAYINLAHGIDVFAMLLFYAALLLVLVLGCRMVLTPAPFSLSRWDIAFPLTSLANAALAYSATGHDAKLQLTAALLLLLASISIAVLCVRTLQALFAGRLSYI